VQTSAEWPGEEPAGEQAEAEIAREIGRVLAAGDATAQALAAEIAGVLAEIDAGRTMLRAAIETGSERVRAEVIAAVGVLGAGFAELGFLVTDVARAAAQIQASLDEQGANVRVIIEQNLRQSAEIRLARQDLAVIERRTRGGAGASRGEQWAGRCPYRGLLSFGEADAEVFYGRERLTTELAVSVARRVSGGGLVVVTGASGAGKSSLLRAGLLPALARGVLVQGSERWPRMVITPGRDPLAELAIGLAALGGGDAAVVRDGLARQPGQAHLAVRQALAADAARRGDERPPGDGIVGRDGRLTRRPVNRADLYGRHPDADRSQIDAVLEAFAAKRLIVLDDGTAQITHDALLAAWPRLRGWLDGDQASWILHGQLTDDAAAWRNHHNDPSFLYRGTQLAALRQASAGWAASPARYPALTTAERDFMTASERAAARATRERRAVAASLVLLLIAALTLAGFARAASRTASQQRNLAQANEMAAEATNLFSADDPLAMLLSLQAYERVAFTPGGQTLAAGEGNGDVVLRRQSLSNLTYGFFSRLICGEVRKNMTMAQWVANAPGQPYQKTCPAYP